jgi:hypothetical protein
MPRVPLVAPYVAGLVLSAVLALAGCGVPPELREASRRTLPTGSPSPTPTEVTPAIPTLPPVVVTPTAADETAATDCQGRPSGEQVIRVLRRNGLLPDSVQVTVARGPMCAGSWQYTVLQAPDREPLQVVTKGEPGSLTLVTAGTDVCGIPVRTGAPQGIRTLAC